jgi:hypothetical protein
LHGERLVSWRVFRCFENAYDRIDKLAADPLLQPQVITYANTSTLEIKDMSSKATPVRVSETAIQAASTAEPETQSTHKPQAQKSQETEPSSPQDFSHERCSELAYSLWHQRGCPEGSADEDWFEAERQLRNS